MVHGARATDLDWSHQTGERIIVSQWMVGRARQCVEAIFRHDWRDDFRLAPFSSSIHRILWHFPCKTEVKLGEFFASRIEVFERSNRGFSHDFNLPKYIPRYARSLCQFLVSSSVYMYNPSLSHCVDLKEIATADFYFAS